MSAHYLATVTRGQGSHLTLVALAARPAPSHFLLANGSCRPLALQAYVYAIFFHRQSLDTDRTDDRQKRTQLVHRDS